MPRKKSNKKYQYEDKSEVERVLLSHRIAHYIAYQTTELEMLVIREYNKTVLADPNRQMHERKRPWD